MRKSSAASLLASLACTLACAMGSSAPAAAELVVFDESRDGDASDNRFAPTMVALGSGMNILRGFSGQSPTPDVHDLDYVTFTVPVGFQLETFVLQSANVGGAFSFVGLQAGPTITIPADWTSIDTPLLGWAHVGSADVGQNLLAYMRVSPGAVGFSGPLPACTYALWIMELNTDVHSYSFGLGVTTVPEPSVLATLLAIGALRRRRGRRCTRGIRAT